MLAFLKKQSAFLSTEIGAGILILGTNYSKFGHPPRLGNFIWSNCWMPIEGLPLPCKPPCCLGPKPSTQGQGPPNLLVRAQCFNGKGIWGSRGEVHDVHVGKVIVFGIYAFVFVLIAVRIVITVVGVRLVGAKTNGNPLVQKRVLCLWPSSTRSANG